MNNFNAEVQSDGGESSKLVAESHPCRTVTSLKTHLFQNGFLCALRWVWCMNNFDAKVQSDGGGNH
jgi:hypothetical protein